MPLLITVASCCSQSQFYLFIFFSFYHQLIFRKVADVKREKELAERRINDPHPSDPAQDHLVRKIFSKFRKSSDTSGGQLSRPSSSKPQPVTLTGKQDIEKGSKASQGNDSKALSQPEDSRSNSATSRASKWASVLGNTSSNLQSVDKDTDESVGGGRRTELVCKKSEHIHVVKDIRPPTQGNKWPRIQSSLRQDTIEENRESFEEFKMVADTGHLSDERVVVHPKSINNTDYQQIVASLIDMRVDLKLEIQKLVKKVNRLDEQLNDWSKRCSPVTPVTGDRLSSNSQKRVNYINVCNNDDSNTSDEIQIQGNMEQIKKKISEKSITRKDLNVGQKLLDRSDLQSNLGQQIKSTDEVRAIMENEIAEQDATDEDKDLTSKL